VPSGNTLAASRLKPESLLESVASLSFIQDPNFSVDDLYISLSVFTVLSEQVWAQAKSQGTPQVVRSLVDTVSRPFSAFNRLASFVCWGKPSEAFYLAEAGFFMRESLTVSLFDNPNSELYDLSFEDLTNQQSLRETLGNHSRLLNSLVTENVPLHRTLNYFAPVSHPNQASTRKPAASCEVISAQNSDYVLIGGPDGKFQVINSALSLPTANHDFNFLENPDKISSKLKKHQSVMEKT